MLPAHAFLFFCCTFFLASLSIPVSSLNIGVHQTTGITISINETCSRKCESNFCSVPPLLSYGKYCGINYSGCPGETPCDDLDTCCMNHDLCVDAKNYDYLSQECSQTFIKCLNKFKKSGGPTFDGNTCEMDYIIEILSVVMEGAMLAGSLKQVLEYWLH